MYSLKKQYACKLQQNLNIVALSQIYFLEKCSIIFAVVITTQCSVRTLGLTFILTLLYFSTFYYSRNGDSQLFDKVRGHDIKLLRYLSIRYICDLMVEKKKVKFGLK